MAKLPDSIEIAIRPTISIDKRTAQTLLALLEAYVNASGERILVCRDDAGNLIFSFESDRRGFKNETN